MVEYSSQRLIINYLHHQENNNDIKESYWQDFCGKIQEYKINFKNCLLVIARHIEELMISIAQETGSFLSKILNNITKIRQKIRPGRHYPRRSKKPYTKWKSSNASKIEPARA